MSEEYMEFTPENVKRFKAAYNETKRAHRQSFMFDGCEVLTDYAKYVIEYLNQKQKEAV